MAQRKIIKKTVKPVDEAGPDFDKLLAEFESEAEAEEDVIQPGTESIKLETVQSVTKSDGTETKTEEKPVESDLTTPEFAPEDMEAKLVAGGEAVDASLAELVALGDRLAEFRLTELKAESDWVELATYFKQQRTEDTPAWLGAAMDRYRLDSLVDKTTGQGQAKVGTEIAQKPERIEF